MPANNDDHSLPATLRLSGAGNAGLADTYPAVRIPKNPALRSSAARLTRILASTAILAGVPLMAEAAFETISASHDATNYPRPGRLLDIGGCRLHINCRSSGTPTVVMDAGLGGSSLDWILVQSELAATTQVCVYDRAGMGWSDKRPLPRSPSQILEELHTLLRQADIAGPYVLVAHSLAGKSARLFADSYREDVACVVLVDTRNEVVDSQISTSEAEGFNRALTLQGEVYSWARRFGVACLLGEALVDQPQLPAGIGLEMALMHTQRAAIDTTTLEGMSRSADDGAISTATLGSIPLVVVASGVSMRDIPHWSDAQEAVAKLNTNARPVVAEHSGHLVQIEEPEIVIASVSDVVARARADR